MGPGIQNTVPWDPKHCPPGIHFNVLLDLKEVVVPDGTLVAISISSWYSKYCPLGSKTLSSWYPFQCPPGLEGCWWFLMGHWWPFQYPPGIQNTVPWDPKHCLPGIHFNVLLDLKDVGGS